MLGTDPYAAEFLLQSSVMNVCPMYIEQGRKINPRPPVTRPPKGDGFYNKRPLPLCFLPLYSYESSK